MPTTITPDAWAAATAATESAVSPAGTFHPWLAEQARRSPMDVQRRPLDALEGWSTDPRTGDIRHHSGGFFRVGGLSVRHDGAAVPRWDQPIIHQPEVGVLGLLVKEFDGVPHALVQAKVEPGNHNHHQLSPTVQATRSNYTRLHGGRAVPYLEYFRERGRGRIVADVRQSEQGAWFYRKRNRNVVVAVTEDVELLEGFRWLPIGRLHQLLREGDFVNMDTRTVLSCLPLTSPSDPPARPAGPDTGFLAALARSDSAGAEPLHRDEDVLSWITDRRAAEPLLTRTVPLNSLASWHRTPDRLHHERGHFFDVIGVRVSADREVASWDQPMLAPRETGVAAFVVRRFEGTLHVLGKLRFEPGYADVAEIGPTVQCAPGNHSHLPARDRPSFLETVLAADPSAIRYDGTLSEEGGRFHHARNRYLVIEADVSPGDVPDGESYRWLTLAQLRGLLRHSHYLNIQARTLVACLGGLLTPG
ncbi:NDP-hexose 2,3-dehydratase family protein [Streptomyces sp. NPDC020875]|uniref:NDP-hexose 2,3-dehydratase family protein n=1 Tax=Streptomyces sp. NPDC020875 TaxID=3154898 RepID=UPI0033DD7D69